MSLIVCKKKKDSTQIMANSILREFIHLFFDHTFQLHRLFGLLYLLQWFTALIWYFKNYNTFINSSIIVTLPLNGVIQSVTASYYVKFSPQNSEYTLPYYIVVQNMFYNTILMFQWIYYSNQYYKVYIPKYIELFFVFLPYYARQLFPKTRFRDSVQQEKKITKDLEENEKFYFYGEYVTIAFYIWSKHFNGFFLNYVRYLDRVNDLQIYHVHLMLICRCWAVTIALFTHTLAVKHYISQTTSFVLYVISYLVTFYSWYQIKSIFLENYEVFFVTFIGVVVNLGVKKLHHFYQLALLIFFVAQRYGYHSLLD